MINVTIISNIMMMKYVLALKRSSYLEEISLEINSCF